VRVLHILGPSRAIGAEAMITHAARRWAEAGIETHVLCTASELDDHATSVSLAGCPTHHLPVEAAPSFLRELQAFLHRGRFDVIHLHEEPAFLRYVLACRRAGKPVARTLHTSSPSTGRMRARRAADHALARNLGVRFVAISSTIQYHERRRFANPTELIPSWVDTRAFAPPTKEDRTQARKRLDVEGVAVASVGNCHWTKNHQAIITALPRLEATYLHAGAEADDEERRLAAWVEVTHRCRFLGRVEPLDVLHAADVYVMPSDEPGVPISMLEAAATGLPCVLADTPGIAELKPVLGEAAVWVTPRPAGIAAGIKEAVERAVDPHGLHERIAERFSVDQGADRYVSLWRTMKREAA
jgi:glycosyltransferase EpsF